MHKKAACQQAATVEVRCGRFDTFEPVIDSVIESSQTHPNLPTKAGSIRRFISVCIIEVRIVAEKTECLKPISHDVEFPHTRHADESVLSLRSSRSRIDFESVVESSQAHPYLPPGPVDQSLSSVSSVRRPPLRFSKPYHSQPFPPLKPKPVPTTRPGPDVQEYISYSFLSGYIKSAMHPKNES